MAATGGHPFKAILSVAGVFILSLLGFLFSSAGKQLLSHFIGKQPPATASPQSTQTGPSTPPTQSQTTPGLSSQTPEPTTQPATPHTPEPNSPERKAICDAMREYVTKLSSKPMPQPLLFKVEFLRVEGDYSGFEGSLVDTDGSAAAENYLFDTVFTTFLKRRAGTWQVVADLTRSDVPSADEIAEIRKNFPADFPASVMPEYWRKLLRQAAIDLDKTTSQSPPVKNKGPLLTVNLNGPGDGVVLKLPEGYPRTAVRIELTVNYTAPGTIFDTVGLNAAPIGAWALVVNGDGRISMNIYDPGRQSPRRISNGWHLLTSKPVAARVDHTIRVDHSGTEIILTVDGATERLALETPLSGQPVFIGDFPGDASWGPRLETKKGMTGRVILHTFGALPRAAR